MATPSRMLVLLSLLQARRDWPGHALAERLEVSERTIRRDVERLRDLGYRIRAIKGPDGGYRLDAGSELPPLLFDDEQAVALAVALQTLAVTGLDEAAARALATVRQVMPSRLRHRIDSVHVTPVTEPQPAVDPAVLMALSSAVRDSVVLRFDYGDAVRRVEPHHLVVRSGRWYLVAFDPQRDDWRTFRVDRLTPRTPTGPRFTPRPLADVATFVSARFKGSSGADEWPCTGSVVLALPVAEVAPYVHSADDLGDGTCRVQLGSWSWVGLAASVARFDAAVLAAEPAQLRDAFAQVAERFGAVGFRG